jgi:hypothetical protein
MHLGPATVLRLDDSILLNKRLACDFYYRYHLDFIFKGEGRKQDIRITVRAQMKCRFYYLLKNLQGLNTDKLCTRDCTSMFSPDITLMHYCTVCERWYHTNCLTHLHAYNDATAMILSREKEDFPPGCDLELLSFAFSPIIRGGAYGPGGWGFEQVKARLIAARMSEGKDLRNSLSTKAVKKVRKLAETEGVHIYQCQCGNRWM